ncbi:TolC family protein [beta proteobacterium MWH-UniP1]
MQKIVANLALGHPELRAYDLQHQIAQYEAQKFYLGTRSAKVDFIAQASADVLSGPGDYGSSAGRLGADQRVGVQITMPLSTGGLNVAKQREALAIAEKALADRALAALALEQQARAAWQMLNSFPASISALESALTSARQRLLETRKAHANGARSTLELLAAEAAVVDAEKQLILEQANHARSWARLQAAAGVMEDKDFHKIQSVLRNKPWAN